MLKIFFNYPSKEWHFDEIVKEAKIVRSKANQWIKKFIKDDLIKRIKKRNKMPYYIGNFQSANYQNKKKIFAFQFLHESGLLNHLASLEQVKTVILFGSFARSDWYSTSDIDIFIYGNTEGLNIAKYELKLHRDIQLFIAENKRDLQKLGNGLIKNIVKGNLIKGDLDFVKVEMNA